MIEIENVWKQYKLGNTVNIQRSFREALTETFSRHKEEPESHDDFWALRDINLSVKAGQTLGLIGHNGAGKSTLLKVLSRITKPTKGKITVHGSLSSLLEVGTGFHPELSGRENIYLYGTIMGMSKRDITKKFDEIVDYAGVDKFLDTPVKRYSSGMYVRLAFSIAAHVEPDILVVDEVLAVGDKEFRDKCLGKMDEVAQSGRTVIFVSHNMNAISSLCSEIAWLDKGTVKAQGDSNTIIDQYENSFHSLTASDLGDRLISGPLKRKLTPQHIKINGEADNYQTSVSPEDPIEIEIAWNLSTPIEAMQTSMSIFHDGIRITTLDDVPIPVDAPAGKVICHFLIPKHTFLTGNFSIGIGAQNAITREWCWGSNLREFSVLGSDAPLDALGANLFPPLGSGHRGS